MTYDEFLKVTWSIVGMLLIPTACIVMINKGRIVDFICRENLEQVELNNCGFETRKHASYVNKLQKVYVLCKELNIDEGFYFDLTNKVKSELDYAKRTLNTELGKELFEEMNKKNKETTP